MTKDKLRKIFASKSNCYADTHKLDKSGGFIEGKVIPAMTEAVFVKTVESILVNTNKWISVDDALPEGFWSDSEQEYYKKFSQQVNVLVDNGAVSTAAYNRESGKWFLGDLTPQRYLEFTTTNVTHWQPLPTNPNTEI